MPGGQFIHDTGKACWLRFGTNILHLTSMVNWDGKLIFGIGDTGGLNLAYLNWSTITELNSAGTGSTITSTWRTPNYDLDVPDCDKQMRAISVVYRDDTDWTDETITVAYRIDEALTGSLPNFTTLGTITLGTYNRTVVQNIDFPNLSNTGRFFQFQFNITGHCEILELIFYYDILPKKY